MKRKKRNKKSEEDFYRDIKKHIDEGHRHFWKQRGLDAPPATSYNFKFGKNAKTGRKSQ